jgi:hypothetical protein
MVGQIGVWGPRVSGLGDEYPGVFPFSVACMHASAACMHASVACMHASACILHVHAMPARTARARSHACASTRTRTHAHTHAGAAGSAAGVRRTGADRHAGAEQHEHPVPRRRRGRLAGPRVLACRAVRGWVAQRGGSGDEWAPPAHVPRGRYQLMWCPHHTPTPPRGYHHRRTPNHHPADHAGEAPVPASPAHHGVPPPCRHTNKGGGTTPRGHPRKGGTPNHTPVSNPRPTSS